MSAGIGSAYPVVAATVFTVMVERHSVASLLERELAAHGTVRPPWLALPKVHPLDAEWERGGGESHLLVWSLWLAGLSPVDAWAKALAALKPHAPIPADWAFWTLDALGLATEEAPYDHAFDDVRAKLGEVGIEVTGSPSSP